MTTVSRETLDRLERYRELLAKWNHRIALIADADRITLETAAALADRLDASGPIIDVGSGNGLPLVPALAAKPAIAPHATLVEADARKAAFLRAVRRECQLPFAVERARVEDLSPHQARWITAQAFAPLPRLLELCAAHLRPDGEYLLSKGRSVRSELAEANEDWHFEVEILDEDPESGRCLLRLGQVERR